MKLTDLRKLSIRQQLKIRFQLANGMECVVTEHGLAQVPALKRAADFNIDTELTSVRQFSLEPVAPAKGTAKSAAAPSRTVTSEELASMIGAPAAAAAAEHEDE
jgi:hypothetical protein